MSRPPAVFPAGLHDARWITLDDDVMGGHSCSRVDVRDGVLTFAGTTSLEDNGGFASIRARGAFDFSAAAAMCLRVRGDGRAYQLRVATDARHRGSNVSWRGDFTTRAGEWTEVSVDFAQMQPTYRGTVLEGRTLDLSRVEEIGLLIGDGRAGDFALDVAWIRPLASARDT
ncbi:CIA30 family protein [Luteimonas sp. 3794]|uniref:CIA30 family protein n=1 Tax=Luteimonas sp. 3794 TaxID=2817730 RepID=UPI0028636456|nr:CIA30 family protein [Luteimonas sp. 3794]MDR6990508.1 monofunctional biosynthetic peptidoglycan transglycosylase [Luteimonas sp. 3794]